MHPDSPPFRSFEGVAGNDTKMSNAHQTCKFRRTSEGRIYGTEALLLVPLFLALFVDQNLLEGGSESFFAYLPRIG